MATTTVTYNGSEIISQDMTAPVAVSYGGSTIVSVAEGETKTLNCNGLYATTNIVVGSKTLNCANHIMASDVVVAVEGSSGGETWWLYNMRGILSTVDDTYYGNFTTLDGSERYSSIRYVCTRPSQYVTNFSLYYGDTLICTGNDAVPAHSEWIDEDYAAITFDEPVEEESDLWNFLTYFGGKDEPD